jgi:predicted molibdopterin-dependent oxidoreductase YjgC
MGRFVRARPRCDPLVEGQFELRRQFRRTKGVESELISIADNMAHDLKVCDGPHADISSRFGFVSTRMFVEESMKNFKVGFRLFPKWQMRAECKNRDAAVG